MEQKGQRADWIDAAKLVAILGVLVDHTQNVLYSNHRIADCSYYSVGLFIFLMGVTGYGASLSYGGRIPETLKRIFGKSQDRIWWQPLSSASRRTGSLLFLPFGSGFCISMQVHRSIMWLSICS